MTQPFSGNTASRRGWKTFARFLTLGLTLAAGGSALAQEQEPIPEEKVYSEKILEEGEGWQLKNISGYAVDDKGQYYSKDIYTLQSGKESAFRLPVVPSLQEELAAAAASTEGDTVFIVDKFIADEIAIAQEKGELTEALKAIAEPLDEGDGKTMGKMGPFGSCSDQFINKSKGFSLNTPISTSTSLGGGFSGTLSATGNLSGSATGEVQLRIKRTKVFWVCIPYAVQFGYAHAWGSATVGYGATVSGTLNYNFNWENQIAKPYLGSLDFFVGPVPVHIGFNLPINLGLNVNASVTGSVSYNSNQNATGSFDYTCTLSSCSGWANYSLPTSSPQPLTASISGRAYPTVWAQVAVRAYLYSEWLAYAQVGVRPYLYGDLWGYYGNSCGDGNGDGINETVSALTFDLDWQLFITAQAAAFGGSPAQWNNLWSTSRKHIKFWDIPSGGSSAIRPILTGPSSLLVNATGNYNSRMRPCWPYGDTVNYQLAWGDSTSTSFSAAPATVTTKSKAWTSAGAKTVALTAQSDSHGRQFNATNSRSVQVNALSGTWTPWLNRDAPGGVGDFETLSDFLTEGFPVCSNPIAIECQTTSGVNWSSTGQVYSCTLSGGTCTNSQQSNGTCLDYQVRFLCP
ncbi:hypothetical protein [Vitiosangium sp. GDMCC 1.1324]|uniref:hypothetical protein n=1 Tax=Vitiosangium sp. (strain GDMCC 1.1324) TaxID=2138576 RepID=UPI000D3755D8|nr:hypothetical protein [Vitiosangium sp. GDMCC 1.1324]PTL76776.1 hypothetical protein DAT35_48500 [Vitiosangium sp. GDMCC 1.1324]